MVVFGVLVGVAGAAEVELTVAGGAGPAAGNARTDPTGRDARPAIGGTLVIDGGIDLVHVGRVALGVEIPLAVGGARSSDVFAQGSYAGIYTERVTAALTPGIRARLAPAEKRVSPWVSFGAGVAVVHRTGNDFLDGRPAAAQVGSSRMLALVPAAGADVRVAPRWFARVEVRNYLYQTPATGFVTSFVFWNRWNHNAVVAGGIGYRFR